MARPFLHALAKRIDALSLGDGDTRLSGEDVLFVRIASGERMQDIADELGCSRPYLYNWRDMRDHKERRKPLWDAAVKARAEAKAEEGEGILDKMALSNDLLTPADVQLARARAEYKWRMAERLDRENYGNAAAAINLNLTVGSLHLDALRQVCAPVIAGVLAAGSEVVEGSLVEEGEED